MSFRGICSFWRSAATIDNFDRSIPRVPWAVYTTFQCEYRKIDHKISEIVRFRDLERHKSFGSANFSSIVDEETNLSSCGWLLHAGVDTGVHLAHPILPVRIELPSLDTFPDFKDWISKFNSQSYIKKMVLSGSPSVNSTGELVIVVICGEKHQLGFCKPVDSSWTMISDSRGIKFEHIVYQNGKLYAADTRMSQIVEYDVSGQTPIQI